MFNKLKRTLKISGAILSMAILVGCGVETSGNIDFNANHVSYHQDSRTNLCYSVVASKQTVKVDTSGLGMTNVPCTDEVLSLIE